MCYFSKGEWLSHGIFPLVPRDIGDENPEGRPRVGRESQRLDRVEVASIEQPVDGRRRARSPGRWTCDAWPAMRHIPRQRPPNRGDGFGRDRPSLIVAGRPTRRPLRIPSASGSAGHGSILLDPTCLDPHGLLPIATSRSVAGPFRSDSERDRPDNQAPPEGQRRHRSGMATRAGPGEGPLRVQPFLAWASAKAESKPRPEEVKPILVLMNVAASAAPYSRSMPGSSHSTESGPS